MDDVVLVDSVLGSVLGPVRHSVRDSMRRVTARRERRLVRVSRASAGVRQHPPSLLPGQLRRTRPDLPLIDAVDGLSDFVQCPHPGCCALRAIDSPAPCPVCHRR